MKADRERVETLFHQALELAPESRKRFLELECGSETIRDEVATLLAHYENPDLTLGRPILPTQAIIGMYSQQWTPILAPGELLASRFRITRRLASGGMGDVYEAEDTQLGEHVALKTIRREIAANPRMLARFKNEVQLAKRVSHPNVCRIHDLGVDERPSGDVVFLTMQLLEGETLADRLEQKPPTLEEVRGIAAQIAAALDAAHAAGVIHRDLKSSNVMLTPGNGGQSRALITDFGIALSAQRDESSDQLTRTGEIVGTPDYMAPEQLLGDPVTHLADIYAFGVILFEMVTCRLPFLGRTGQGTGAGRLQRRPPSPREHAPDLPASWERAILRCMDFDPNARFSSAGEVVQALAPPRTLAGVAVVKLGSRLRAHVAWLLPIICIVAGVAWWSISRIHSSRIAAQPHSQPQTTAVANGAKIHYERGLYYWNLRTQEGFVRAIEEYKVAIQADPNFAPAHAGLAWVLAMQSGFKPPRQVFPEAKQYAQSAIKLDDKLASGHAALAFVNFYYDWDWKGAESEFRRAIQLDPNYASAHSNYAILLSTRKRFPEALEQASLAEQADPVSAAVATGLGRVYYWSGRYREAIDQFQRVLAMHPQFTQVHLGLANALYRSNRPDEAMRQISFVLTDSMDSGAMADLAHIYAGMGEKDLARDMLLKLENLRSDNSRYVSPCNLAIAYGALGQRDQAFRFLNDGLRERTFDMVYLTVDSQYASLRQDERWRRIVRAIGLAQ